VSDPSTEHPGRNWRAKPGRCRSATDFRCSCHGRFRGCPIDKSLHTKGNAERSRKGSGVGGITNSRGRFHVGSHREFIIKPTPRWPAGLMLPVGWGEGQGGLELKIAHAAETEGELAGAADRIRPWVRIGGTLPPARQCWPHARFGTSGRRARGRSGRGRNRLRGEPPAR